MSHYQRGFTLIEVLVALVIIAYVGISSQQRIGQFFDERDLLVSKQHAHWVAWNELMRQYQISQNWYPQNEQKPEKRGDVQSMGRTWFYQTEEQKTVTEGFLRYETSVGEAAFSDVTLGQTQTNSANLVMFLVKP